MTRVWISLASAAVLLFAVQPIAAETNVESELAEMRELVQGLKKQVDAQDEQLSHQGELLEQAQGMAREAQSDSLSSLADFVDSIDVDGHLAGSWNYNFNKPETEFGGSGDDEDLFDSDTQGRNVGEDGIFLPFHRDSNTFTLDQLWIGIGKPATAESRAGFRVDFLYGQNANFLGQGTMTNNNGDSISRRTRNYDGTSDLYIAQAYIEYMCSCGDLNFKYGKWQTMLGAEVAQATGNFNITRGNVYALLQPVDHFGLLGTVEVGPAQIQAAIVNSGWSGISSPDNNKEKSYIGSVMLGDDKMSLRTTFVYGADGYIGGDDHRNNSVKTGLVDVTAWFNPTDNVSLWANYNYLYLEGTGAYVNGIAIAGRVGVTDDLGVALRAEYVASQAASNANGGDDSFFELNGNEEGGEIYSLTGTVDYALTDHLTLRGEVRWDLVEATFTSGDEVFFSNDDHNVDDQTVALIEAVYEF